MKFYSRYAPLFTIWFDYIAAIIGLISLVIILTA